LLVVLAIMIAIASILLPLALDDAKRASLTEAREQLEAVLLSARADAQRTGKTVRVAAFEQDGRWLLAEEEVQGADATSGASVDEANAPGVQARILQVTSLPEGVRIGQTRDAAEGKKSGTEADGGENDGQDWEGPPLASGTDDVGGSVDGVEVQVALFLPDGQVVATRPLFIGGADGRVGELSLNSWTGMVEMRVLPPRTSEAEEGGDDGDSGAGKDIGAGGAGQER
jgi:type II secretory pathway pseudopilin PulG